jgi:hypothetical protein
LAFFGFPFFQRDQTILARGIPPVICPSSPLFSLQHSASFTDSGL